MIIWGICVGRGVGRVERVVMEWGEVLTKSPCEVPSTLLRLKTPATHIGCCIGLIGHGNGPGF